MNNSQNSPIKGFTRLAYFAILAFGAYVVIAPGQWSDFSTKTASKNLSNAMNAKPAVQVSTGIPFGDCTPGKDFYLQTDASPIAQMFYCYGAPNSWAALYAGYPQGATSSIGGGALLAGACASGTATTTGALTNQAVIAAPTTYPGDGIYWKAYVSASDQVTVKVCAAVAATPTASSYQVRVLP